MVDSDFSIDEDDEVRSDLDDGEDDKKRKRGGVHTKAYKVKKTITFLKNVFLRHLAFKGVEQ